MSEINKQIVRVALIGANGKMGKLADQIISNMPNYSIVARVTRQHDLDQVLKEVKPEVAIDLTSCESVLYNSSTIIKNKVRPLIGTSGLSATDISDLVKICENDNLGGLIIPNFSIGIALLNKFALDCKKYFNDFSILEFHHKQKKDKVSGTARYLANIVGVEESNIASIRSDGFLAKQQIFVNTEYERIQFDHESFDRRSFSKGIELSMIRVLELNHLVVGLENIL